MFRSWIAVGVFACVLGAVLGGYQLNALNSVHAVERFQQLQRHTAGEIAAILRNEITGASTTLRALAVALSLESDPGQADRLLGPQAQCGAAPCAFRSIATYGADGRLVRSFGTRPALGPGDVAASLAWARDPANASDIRTVTAPGGEPTLVLVTPVVRRPNGRGGHEGPDGLLAAELDLETIFADLQRQQGMLDPGWPRHQTLVLESDGTVVFHSRHPEMRLNNVFKRTDACFTCHQSFDHVERMIRMRNGLIEYKLRGADQLAAVAPLDFDHRQWIVSVAVPRESVTGVLSAQYWQLIAIMGAVVLVVLGAGALTRREARRRITAEAEAAQKAPLERSHAELQALNAKLGMAAREWRTTVDAIDAALIVLEPTRNILRMNVVAASTLPDTLLSWLGQPSGRLAAYPPWDTALSLAREALTSSAISTARAKDPASDRTWDLWCRALTDSQQTPAVVVVARDITAVVKLQESVRRSQTMAALGSVVAGVAHEVRNPLFSISALVDAWSIQAQRDPRPFADALRSAVTRLETLMSELLDYGRPPTVELAPHALGPVLDEAVRACVGQADVRRVRIGPRPPVDARVMMAPERLVRVFINLIQNAVQHAPESSEVTVEIRESPGPASPQIEVVVRDRGPGFKAEDLPRVFEPFFSRRAGGFGLGLAITERIVTEHGGTVSAANDPAGGAAIGVMLPVVAGVDGPAAEGAKATC